MVSRVRLAGILGIVSLIMPFYLVFFSYDPLHGWVLRWLIFDFGQTYDGNILLVSYSRFLTYYLQFYAFYGVLRILAFILLLTGVILLIIKPKQSRAGGLLLLGGCGFTLVVWLVEYILNYFPIIPFGLIIAFVAGIIALSSKTVIVERAPATPITPPSTGKT